MAEQVKLRREAVEWREVEGEIVALDLRDSMYLAINHSGAVLWPLLVEGATHADLVAKLVAEYEIDEATATTDVDAFLGAMRERDLVEDVAA